MGSDPAADTVLDHRADQIVGKTEFMIRTIALVTGCLLSCAVGAEQIRWKGFDIYYTTFPSTVIPPEVASLHNIVRGEQRILTNITVRRNGTPTRASVAGTATNLLGQTTRLAFSEIIEPEAIYYLANQLVSERDTLRYIINVRPLDHDGDPYRLTFERRYYDDGRQQ